MTTVPVPGMRSTISDGSHGLSIVIPAPRQIAAMLFLPVWLVGWAFGEVFAARQLLKGGMPGSASAFMAVWLTGWTIGGSYAILTLVWMVAGRERIVIGSGRLVHRRELLGLALTKEYDLTSVKNIHVDTILSGRNSRRGAGQFGFGGPGPITFDYGAQTVRIGAGVDDAEARMLVHRIVERHPGGAAGN